MFVFVCVCNSVCFVLSSCVLIFLEAETILAVRLFLFGVVVYCVTNSVVFSRLRFPKNRVVISLVVGLLQLYCFTPVFFT